MRRFLILLLLALPFHFINADETKKTTTSIQKMLNRFHVCTVSSNPHPNLDKLIKSCKMHDIDLEVLGMGKPYYKNGTKYIYMREYLDTLKDNDIVLFVDAYDVLIVADKKIILEKFLAMETPFLMGSEKNCAPDGFRRTKYPKTPGPFKYINTGTYMGYVKVLKAWLDDMKPIATDSDQRQTTVHYLKNPTAFFTIDHNCELFITLLKVKPNEIKIDAENKKFHCLTTKTTPCVLHANGYAFAYWNKAYEALVKQ